MQVSPKFRRKEEVELLPDVEHQAVLGLVWRYLEGVLEPKLDVHGTVAVVSHIPSEVQPFHLEVLLGQMPITAGHDIHINECVVDVCECDVGVDGSHFVAEINGHFSEVINPSDPGRNVPSVIYRLRLCKYLFLYLPENANDHSSRVALSCIIPVYKGELKSILSLKLVELLLAFEAHGDH